MAAAAAVYTPLSGLRLFGAGDRSARSPAPGAMPRDEPLLPRLETLLGSMANVYAGLRGLRCTSWGSCVLAAALRLLLGEEVRGLCAVSPPMLVVWTRSGEQRVYIDAGSWLLRVDSGEALHGYMGAAELLYRSLTEQLPRRRLEAEEEAEDAIRELIEEGSLIPFYAVSRRLTHVAVNPVSKTAVYNLLYSLPWVSYNTVAMPPGGEALETLRARIVVLAACSNGEPQGLDTVATLGPKSAPSRLYTRALPGGAADTLLDAPEQPPGGSLVASLQPLASCCPKAIHPGNPSPLELHVAAYRTSPTYGAPPETTPPRPALRPGTLLLSPPNARNCYLAGDDKGTAMVKLLRSLPPTVLEAVAEYAKEAATM